MKLAENSCGQGTAKWHISQSESCWFADPESQD